MPKQFHYGDDARNRLFRGARLLAKTVSTTYGPHGRTCILDRMAGLLSTKDGVTVAREINVSDPVENIGCQALKEACVKVNDEAGDGTTTTAAIAAALLTEGQKSVAAGMNPILVSRGIQAAVKAASERLLEMALPIETQEELERVAIIASNGDTEISSLMAEACMGIGRDGTIIIEDGRGVESTLIFKEGMEIHKGMASSGFLLSSESEWVIEKCLVAVVNAPLKTMEDVQDILEVGSQWPDNPTLLFVPSISGEALATMVLNNSSEEVNFRCCAICAPGIGAWQQEHLKDIAALAGADYVDPIAGYSHTNFNHEWFGSLRKVSIGLTDATLEAYPEAQEVIQKRLKELKGEERHCTSEYDRDRLRERRAKLSSGLAVMEVGGVTEAALKERRARVEDALGAVRAALEGGVVPGGGAAYLAASLLLGRPSEDQGEEFLAGWHSFRLALREPLRLLAHNAGKMGALIVRAVEEMQLKKSDAWWGWDALQDGVRNLGDDPPIMDPTLVALSVVQAAGSSASTILTTEVSITDL